MKRKSLLLAGLLLMFAACSSTSTYEAGKLDDPLQILEAKREQYKRQDEEKRIEAAKLEEEKQKLKAEVVTEIQDTNTENMDVTEIIDERAKLEEAKRLKKEEKERVKVLPLEEKMQYKVNKAMERINAMAEVANKAREEEIANQASIDEIEMLLNPEKATEMMEVETKATEENK